MKLKIDSADLWFSKFIRLRDGKCMRCGSPVQFNDKGDPITHQCSHYKGRRKEATRFDPNNCISLCYGCHQYWHEHPTEYDDWMVKNKGLDIVNAINVRTCMYKKKDRKFEVLIWKQAYKNLREEKYGKN